VRAILVEELSGRQRSSIASRRKAAGFPTGKTFEAWNDSVSSIPKPTQRSLRTLEWIDRHENLVVCGPSGTGKTHFLEALGQSAIDAGHHVSWFSLLANQTITFSLSGPYASLFDGRFGEASSCTATTNGSGVATCALPPVSLGALILTPTYTAAFAGTANYVAISATGKINALAALL
jgi:hypothetical protein